VTVRGVLRSVKFSLFAVIQKMMRIAARINPKIPARLEIESQRAQGKGFDGGVDYEVQIARAFLIEKGITELVVLDVGANIGDYSAAVHRVMPHAKIFAFEPSTFALKALERRFQANSSVTIVPFALGSSNSTEILWSDVEGSEMGSLTKRRLDHFEIGFNVSESIEVITLDNWAKTIDSTPNFIKLDVEGHESEVLKGGTKTISTAQLIQFEFGGANIDSRTFFRDLWYLLTECGFSIYRISPVGPILISRYSESLECFSYSNFFAVRK
jgi:FkbM family methyltransferase